MTHFHHVIDELREPAPRLATPIPDAWAGFSALHDHALAPGTVPTHIKELVALAISVSKQCEGCIAYHAHERAMKGANREEVAEVLAVALLMDGGPASTYAPHAWAAFNEFRVTRRARNRRGPVMDQETWNQRYASDDLVWSAEPNRFLVAEVEGLAPGRLALDLACGEGQERGSGSPNGLDGHRRRLRHGRYRQSAPTRRAE